MTRHHIAAISAAVTLAVSACDGSETGVRPHVDQSSRSTPSARGSTDAQAKDLLDPAPADALAAIDSTVLRADDGTSVVVSTNQMATRTTYRIYSPRWRPLTPTLQLRGDLVIDRGLRDSFIGEFTVTGKSGRLRVDEHVTVRSDGTLAVVRDGAGPREHRVRTQPGDRRISPLQPGRMVYRPATDTVYRTPTPRWDDPARSWYRTAAGEICALGRSARLGATIHVSVDEGRTFTDLSTRVLPASSGARVQSCETAGDRVAVMTGGEYPRWVHVLDRVSGTLLASHFVGDPNGPYNPYGWRLLPDGKLVFDTNRPGLYVATDTTDKVLEFRPHPRLRNATTVVIGDDLALLSGVRRLLVSRDEGRTWSPVLL